MKLMRAVKPPSPAVDANANIETVELAADYYLEHFAYLLQFVAAKYADLLQPDEQAFIQQFSQLSHDAKCLLVRLANRKPRYFRYSQLVYPEITDLDQALQTLLAKGLCVSEPRVEEIEELLGIFRKAELLQLASKLESSQPAAKLTKLAKAELVHLLATEFDSENLLAEIQDQDQDQEKLLRLCCEAEISLVKFLFFGSLRPNMDQFVIRDLGHIRYESFNDADLEPYFKTRQQVKDKLAVYTACEQFEVMKEQQQAQPIYEWFLAWQSQHAELDIIAQPGYDRLVLKVARFLERAECQQHALAIYRLTEKPPARERQVRLLQSVGQSHAAVMLCQQIKDDPRNAAERLFALDFLARQEQQSKRLTVTQVLKQAPVITLDRGYQGQVEQGVLDDYHQRGWSGFWAENHVWRSLFGLLCWDLLFDPASGAIHHPFQRSPSDLYQADFFANRRDQLEARFALLDNMPACQAELERVLQHKWGFASPFVSWHEDLPDVISACCKLLSAIQLKSILLEMAHDPQENGHGFPDLLVWNKADYEFIEVKSPRDRLSAQQLHWLGFFAGINVNAKVLRVKWGE